LCLTARRHAPYLVQFQERAHAFQVLVATEKRARAEAEFSAQRRTGPPVVTIRRSQLLSDGFSQLNLVCTPMLVRSLAFHSSTFAVCAHFLFLHCPVAIRRLGECVRIHLQGAWRRRSRRREPGQTHPNSLTAPPCRHAEDSPIPELCMADCNLFRKPQPGEVLRGCTQLVTELGMEEAGTPLQSLQESTLTQTSTFRLLLQPGEVLRGRVRIQFVNELGMEEAGIDGGGLFKDFMEHLVQEVGLVASQNVFCEIVLGGQATKSNV